MNFIILLVLIVTAIVGLFWLLKKEKATEENEVPSYVCPECGDHHCNCYLDKKEEK